MDSIDATKTNQQQENIPKDFKREEQLSNKTEILEEISNFKQIKSESIKNLRSRLINLKTRYKSSLDNEKN